MRHGERSRESLFLVDGEIQTYGPKNRGRAVDVI